MSKRDCSKADDDVVRLEVKGATGEWRDVDTPVGLLSSDDEPRTKDLPRAFADLFPREDGGRRLFSYRRSADGSDTNLLVLLHGSGDAFSKYDELARTMALPQTACLSLSAALSFRNDETDAGFATIPFDLGHAWFEEVDYFETGAPLSVGHPRRSRSLERATRGLRTILKSLAAASSKTHNDDGGGGGWMPERVFLFGFGSGASLIMETLLDDATRDDPSMVLGGAVCVAGGARAAMNERRRRDGASRRSKTSSVTTTTATTRKMVTPILLLVGSQDESFAPAAAEAAKACYVDVARNATPESSSSSSAADEIVSIHVQKGKRFGMISCEEEMRAVMTFFADKLVRRSSLKS